jgi:molecular chaperone GrpE (heat shock protein)
VEDTSGSDTVAVAPDDAGEEHESPLPDPMAQLAAAVSDVVDQARSHHARADARERVIDQLHAEVERLRVGQESLLLRPVVTDLQNLRGDLLRQAQALPADLDREQMIILLQSFALSVELALERCGSVPIRPEPGARFSPREHRAVKVIAAVTPEQDGTIAEVVADGYVDNQTEKVITAAKVHVWRWEPAGDANDSESEGTADD